MTFKFLRIILQLQRYHYGALREEIKYLWWAAVPTVRAAGWIKNKLASSPQSITTWQTGQNSENQPPNDTMC